MPQILKSGNYLGIKNKSLDFNGILITDTAYSKTDVFPSHSHENLYIAYVIEGNYIESNKHETQRCLPGSVVLHRTDEKHSNASFADNSRVLNVEIDNGWLNNYSISSEQIEKYVNSNSFELKLALTKLYNEFLINDFLSPLGVESNLLRTVCNIVYSGSFLKTDAPRWVREVREILHYEEPANLNLNCISKATGIHPMHISRDFSRYFICTMSEYVRRLKIEKAELYLNSNNYSLAEISFICGFSDQSHFTRTFKNYKGITPQVYKDLLLN